jgi:quercetin dioxygenase-like cupin family protein
MTATNVEDPVGRQRLAFEQVEDEHGDQVLLVEVWVDPGGDVPPHIHPHVEERFLVLDGEVTFTAGRGKRRATAGETVVVPKGTRHAFRNTGTTEAHMRVRVRPPGDLEEYLTAVAALGSEGHVARLGPLRVPRGLAGIVRSAEVLRRGREHTLVLMPPPVVQRLLMDPLARRAAKRTLSSLEPKGSSPDG